MIRLIKNLLKFIAGLLVILVIWSLVTHIAHADWIRNLKYKFYKEGRDYFLEDPSGYEEEYIAMLKTQSSEIEGMTRYDKLEAGLNPYLADTDGDGITDKDEMDIGSDPTKASTSGDCYPDSYKVLNNMDLNTYYDYVDGSATLNGILCDDVTTVVVCAEDWRCEARSCPIDPAYRGVYGIYRVSGFNGVLSINLSKKLHENNVTMDDIAVYGRGFWDDGKLEKVKYSKEGESIYFDSGFGLETKYIYIVNKKDFDVEANSVEGAAIMFGSPAYRYFLNGNYHVWYTNTGDAAVDEMVYNRMIEEATDVTSANRVPLQTPKDDIKVATPIEIEARYNIMKMLLPMFECDNSDEMRLWHALYYYSRYSTIVKHDRELSSMEGRDKSIFNDREPFDFDKDILPFKNFASEIALNGNCAGIAILTARTFNGHYIPSTGDYDVNVTSTRCENYSWDLTTDEANQTLQDSLLYDFKDKDFVDDHTAKEQVALGSKLHLVNTDLSEGEKQFINMLGCYWGECNDRIRTNYDYVYLPEGMLYDFNMIEEAERLLDNNNIICAGFRTFKTGGHAVNIVGYDALPNGNVKLYVYDSNFPDRKDLYVLIEPDDNGKFQYIYSTPKYKFSSRDMGNMFCLFKDDYEEVGTQVWGLQGSLDIEQQKYLEEQLILYKAKKTLQ